jgi:hypothetical protein
VYGYVGATAVKKRVPSRNEEPNEMGDVNGRVAAGCWQLIFSFGVPSLCLCSVLIYYMRAQEYIWFFCWFFLYVIVTIAFLIRARRMARK